MAGPTPLAAELVQTLVEAHRRLVHFLEPRVGGRADAEEVLQAAFVGSIQGADTVRNDEGVLDWFHRLVSKAIIEQHRRRIARDDPSRGLSVDVPELVEAPELLAAARAFVSALVGTLRSEHGAMLRRIDLAAVGTAGAASDEGLGVQEAALRLHRARMALRQRVTQACGTCLDHGGLDCECKAGVRSGG